MLPVGVRRVNILRDGGLPVQDLVAVEEPLEIRVEGRPLAVTMRTPGDDEDLAAGFLYSEGVIDEPGQIESIEVLAPESGDLVDLGRGSTEESRRIPNRVAITLRGELDEHRFDKASRE